MDPSPPILPKIRPLMNAAKQPNISITFPFTIILIKSLALKIDHIIK